MLSVIIFILLITQLLKDVRDSIAFIALMDVANNIYIMDIFQDETDSIAETEADREMKRERESDGDREGGAINLTSRQREFCFQINKQTETNN